MTKHIGIVACSAEGASLCYRTICVEGGDLLGRHAHPEISMHTPSLAEYVVCLERGDWEGVAELMLASAEKLAAIGAEFLISPDNTIHQAFALVEARSPLPWIHIGDVVADKAMASGFKRLAITGTRWLVESNVYSERLAARGLDFVRPIEDEAHEIDRIIMDELVKSRFEARSTERVITIIERMKQDDCDAVILGCTELPLIIDDLNAPLPTLDSTRLLARAALQRATA